MAERNTVFVSGKVYWCKLLGTPRSNYEGTGREWTVEFEPNDVTFLKQHGLLDRLKNKYEDRGDFITLRKKEFTNDGVKNEPVRIYDANNEPWSEEKLIGNGSEADAKIQIVDYGKGKKKGVYLSALRITSHVPYVSNEFGGMDGPGDSKAQPGKRSVAEDFDDLNDEVPL